LQLFFFKTNSKFHEKGRALEVFKSAIGVFLNPLSEENKEIASRIFVFPAPFSP
jgi:hypothetical protein